MGSDGEALVGSANHCYQWLHIYLLLMGTCWPSIFHLHSEEYFCWFAWRVAFGDLSISGALALTNLSCLTIEGTKIQLHNSTLRSSR